MHHYIPETARPRLAPAEADCSCIEAASDEVAQLGTHLLALAAQAQIVRIPGARPKHPCKCCAAHAAVDASWNGSRNAFSAHLLALAVQVLVARVSGAHGRVPVLLDLRLCGLDAAPGRGRLRPGARLGASALRWREEDLHGIPQFKHCHTGGDLGISTARRCRPTAHRQAGIQQAANRALRCFASSCPEPLCYTFT